MKKFFTGCFTFITSVIAVCYLTSCFTPLVSPVYFWPMAFLALGFPYLAACILSLAFIWLFIKRKVAGLLVLLLLAGFQNLYATFGFNAVQKQEQRAKNTLRILTWNVRGFDNPAASGDSLQSVRRRMFTYLKSIDADVVCFQEFTEHRGADFMSNTAELINLGYRYYYKTNDFSRVYYWGAYSTGSAIFSKIPLTDTGKTMMGDTSYPESIAYADVMLQNRPLRVFTVHFKSINLFAQLLDPDNRVIFHGDTSFVYDESKFQKLKIFAQDHAREALIAKAQLNKSPYPLVYTADMNSVPASFAYHTMSKDLQDAFITKGLGIGTTLDSLPKTLRIDFLLIDKKISITHYQKDELHLSDHFPQFVDLSWKE